MSKRRTIAFDFDGVLHSYNGWNGGRLAGPIPGALNAVVKMRTEGNEVVVFTTRDKATVDSWLYTHGFPPLEVTNIKRPFYVMVDDRAVTFQGTWDEETLQAVRRFEPYWIEARKDP